MDYGRWSNRIFTKKPHHLRAKRFRERQQPSIFDDSAARRTKFSTFVRKIFNRQKAV